MASEKFLDSTNFDFANSDIIKPPFEPYKNKEVGNTFTRLVIDSRDRDLTIFPLPSSYTVELETDILEVTTAEIIIKDISLPQYIINVFNNTFTVLCGADSQTVTLPVGNYTSATFANVLGDALGIGYTVTYDVPTDKYTIKSVATISFTLVFGSTDTALIMGFSNASNNTSNALNTSTTTGTLVAPFRTNFDNIDRYVVLRIGQFTINNSTNPVLHKSTALIGVADAKGIRSITPIKKYFNPPIARLVKLNISFTDYYGNPYDFQNKDHRLEIMLESRKHLSRYSAFV